MDSEINISQWYLDLKKIQTVINDKVVADYGISYDQYLILVLIDSSKHVTPTMVAEHFKTSKPASSRKLSFLMNKDLVKKEHNFSSDQRRVEISLTPDGENIVNQIKETEAGFIDDLKLIPGFNWNHIIKRTSDISVQFD